MTYTTRLKPNETNWYCLCLQCAAFLEQAGGKLRVVGRPDGNRCEQCNMVHGADDLSTYYGTLPNLNFPGSDAR
jgi:hypothetical protein